MCSGLYEEGSKIALEDTLQFMAIAISYTAVTLAFWKLNRVAIWLAILFHLYFGFMLGIGLMQFWIDSNIFTTSLVLIIQDGIWSFLSIPLFIAVVSGTKIACVYFVFCLSLGLPMTKWVVHRNIRVLDQIFEVGEKS
jgi:hypothetical protein